MTTVTFEKRNKEVFGKRDTVNYIARTSNTKQEAVNRLCDILSSDILVGFGGSHVWAVDGTKNRLFIITGW